MGNNNRTESRSRDNTIGMKAVATTKEMLSGIGTSYVCFSDLEVVTPDPS